jgi:hypothetical protein
MALSKNALRITKILYWVFTIAIHLFITYTLFVTDRAIAGILWLVLGLLLIYIVYPFYFPPGDAVSHWPPYIAGCPDYLTSIGPNLCVDYVGLGSPRLQRSDPTLSPPPASDTAHVFNAAGSVHEKAQKAQQYGLTWEGIA